MGGEVCSEQAIRVMRCCWSYCKRDHAHCRLFSGKSRPLWQAVGQLPRSPALHEVKQTVSSFVFPRLPFAFSFFSLSLSLSPLLVERGQWLTPIVADTFGGRQRLAPREKYGIRRFFLTS